MADHRAQLLDSYEVIKGFMKKIDSGGELSVEDSIELHVAMLNVLKLNQTNLMRQNMELMKRVERLEARNNGRS